MDDNFTLFFLEPIDVQIREQKKQVAMKSLSDKQKKEIHLFILSLGAKESEFPAIVDIFTVRYQNKDYCSYSFTFRKKHTGLISNNTYSRFIFGITEGNQFYRIKRQGISKHKIIYLDLSPACKFPQIIMGKNACGPGKENSNQTRGFLCDTGSPIFKAYCKGGRFP